MSLGLLAGWEGGEVGRGRFLFAVGFEALGFEAVAFEAADFGA